MYNSPECAGLLLSRADTLPRHSRTKEHVLSEMHFRQPTDDQQSVKTDSLPTVGWQPNHKTRSIVLVNHRPSVRETNGTTDGRTTLPPPVRRPCFLREEREREGQEGGREERKREAPGDDEEADQRIACMWVL